jgi:hypothetical protein
VQIFQFLVSFNGPPHGGGRHLVVDYVNYKKILKEPEPKSNTNSIPNTKPKPK